MDKLYDIQFDENYGDEITNYMYYRSDVPIMLEPGYGRALKKRINYDFFTYFNTLSIAKWRKYTNLRHFCLVLEAKGDFELFVFGHYPISTGTIKKEYFCKERIKCDERQQITISIPEGIKSLVVGFSIFTHKKTFIYDAYWATDFSNVSANPVNIALSTTTFKKETYIFKNTAKLKQQLFNDEKYSSHFHWYIVDNGQSLSKESIEDENITIVPNPNVGGAGGFARGMMESIRHGGYTHVLLMDDDVEMTIESFKRLYLLLKYVKEEYSGNFISGAMLKMEEPNVQHEDVGVFDLDGRHHPAKPMLDLNLWDSIVKNESYMYTDELHYYAGWWFCCVPIQYVTEKNLPLPIFVRGDDVEYSIRNTPGFISMNGICIWHEGFEGKFSAAMEFYQVERNELIVAALHDELADVDVIGRIERFFWEEIYKFNYKGASLLLDSIEDYLKGPDYVYSLDGGQVMKEKKKLDNKPIQMTGEIWSLIPEDNSIYEWTPIEGRLKKLIYDYTCNWQMRLPELIFGGMKNAVIPYGWGYFQSKMCFARKIIAVDLRSEKYVVFIKNRKEFSQLRKRHKELMERYKNENNEVSKLYKDAFNDVVSLGSWEKKTVLE